MRGERSNLATCYRVTTWAFFITCAYFRILYLEPLTNIEESHEISGRASKQSHGPTKEDRITRWYPDIKFDGYKAKGVRCISENPTVSDGPQNWHAGQKRKYESDVVDGIVIWSPDCKNEPSQVPSKDTNRYRLTRPRSMPKRLPWLLQLSRKLRDSPTRGAVKSCPRTMSKLWESLR